MKVVFISQRLGDNVCSKIHLKAFETIVSKEDLLIIDLNRLEKKRTEGNRVFFGGFDKREKLEWLFQQTTWFLTNERIDRICQYIKNFNAEIVFVDDACLGKVVKKIKDRFPKIKVITFYHDIIADLYRQNDRKQDWKFKVLMYHAALKGENYSQNYSDKNMVLNERDDKLYQKYYGKKADGFLTMAVAEPELNSLNAVELDFELIRKQNKRVILFVGALYKPNLDGLQWFVDNVFQNLSDEYFLLVIGRKLETLKDNYKNIQNMMIVGGVDKLAPYYNNADIVIAPIFSGGGMKQKTAEAFAYGRTFIGTTESLQGYESELNLEDNHHRIVFSCDTPEGQLEAFEYIERNKTYGFHQQLNKAYNEKYSVKAIERSIRKLLEL